LAAGSGRISGTPSNHPQQALILLKQMSEQWMTAAGHSPSQMCLLESPEHRQQAAQMLLMLLQHHCSCCAALL
jgi:hypothetical protein